MCIEATAENERSVQCEYKISNQSLTNAHSVSAIKRFRILFRILYVVEFALSQFRISHFIRPLIMML